MVNETLQEELDGPIHALSVMVISLSHFINYMALHAMDSKFLLDTLLLCHLHPTVSIFFSGKNTSTMGRKSNCIEVTPLYGRWDKKIDFHTCISTFVIHVLVNMY